MLKLNLFYVLLTGLLGMAFMKAPVAGNDACSLYGTITNKQNTAPVAYASLLLLKPDHKPAATAVSDAKGRYCFKNIAAGKYEIRVTAPGFHTGNFKQIEIKSPGSLQHDIQLTYITPSQELVKKNQEAKAKIDGKAMDAEKLEVVSYSWHNANNTKAIYKSTIPGRVGYADYNTEEYHKIDDNGFKSAGRDPLSTFSIDVDKASYSNVRRFITQGSMPPEDAVRVEEMINYFSYHYEAPKGSAPFSIHTEYTECPWNNKHSLVHIGLQGKQVNTENMPPNNLVFLLDVSGSMAGELPLLKSGLRLLVEQMREQDRVAIVVYAGAAGVVLPSTSGAHKAKILDALEQLQAGGSTAGGEGILLAYKTAKENFDVKANNRVILATDGDFNVGVSSEGELVRIVEEKRKDGIYLTVLGFGTGNYKDSKMEQLADKGNGNYAYIDNILEAKKMLVKEMGGTLLTIAKDVKLQVEFNPAKVKGYRLVGYENRLLNNEDFNDDTKDAGELGAGHTVTAIYEIIPAGSDEPLATTDPLKYQKTQTAASITNEIMTIKFRYKAPKDSTSKLLSQVVDDKKTPFAQASENCRFAGSVAAFGMLLRNSKYKGNATYENVLTLARNAKGKDEEGYRAEFIRLVEMAELLAKQQASR